MLLQSQKQTSIMNKPTMRYLANLCLCLLLSGCYMLQSAQVPLEQIEYNAREDATGLVVFLPGMFDYPDRFEKEGLIDVVRRVAPGFDMVAVNSHFGYYRNRSIVDRLHDEVIAPREHAYHEIWLVGVSLGGAGVSSFVSEYPENIERVILLAPYLGEDDLIAEIAAAGGLEQWRPQQNAAIDDVVLRQFTNVWDSYRRISNKETRGPEIMIGYGADDDMALANSLLAEALPSESVATIPGGHNWRVWVDVFDQLVSRVK